MPWQVFCVNSGTMKIIFKLDGVMLVRLLVGLLFLGVGIYYKDWIPGIFGGFWILAAFLRRGCGYGNCNLEQQPKSINNQEETTFTEIK